ncbi:hypothetical protein RTBOTA2_004747 [Rhodotorula toruloides]|nr:hypothetical protein RTBOTA2_004747 [Rhodotorula toruloides]
MFAAFRNAGRAAIRARRSYSTAAPGAEDTNAFIASRKAVEEHAKHSADLWRKITYYVAFPAVIVAALNAKSLASEHEAHLEHIKEENGGELPERIVYPCTSDSVSDGRQRDWRKTQDADSVVEAVLDFNKREKDFPWGDNTLFYNPKVNIPVQ